MAYKGFDLDGKVSLITGGNGGIGFGMADALAEAGADICIWGTNPTKNANASEKLKKHGRKGSIRGKRLQSGWNDEFLLEVLRCK